MKPHSNLNEPWINSSRLAIRFHLTPQTCSSPSVPLSEYSGKRAHSPGGFSDHTDWSVVTASLARLVHAYDMWPVRDGNALASHSASVHSRSQQVNRVARCVRHRCSGKGVYFLPCNSQRSICKIRKKLFIENVNHFMATYVWDLQLNAICCSAKEMSGLIWDLLKFFIRSHSFLNWHYWFVIIFFET